MNVASAGMREDRDRLFAMVLGRRCHNFGLPWTLCSLGDRAEKDGFFRLKAFSESFSATQVLLIVSTVNSLSRPTVSVGPVCCWLSRC